MEFLYFLFFCNFCVSSLERHTPHSHLIVVNRLLSTSMHDLIIQYAFSLLGIVMIVHTPSCSKCSYVYILPQYCLQLCAQQSGIKVLQVTDKMGWDDLKALLASQPASAVYGLIYNNLFKAVGIYFNLV